MVPEPIILRFNAMLFVNVDDLIDASSRILNVAILNFKVSSGENFFLTIGLSFQNINLLIKSYLSTQENLQ